MIMNINNLNCILITASQADMFCLFAVKPNLNCRMSNYLRVAIIQVRAITFTTRLNLSVVWESSG